MGSDEHTKHSSAMSPPTTRGSHVCRILYLLSLMHSRRVQLTWSSCYPRLHCYYGLPKNASRGDIQVGEFCMQVSLAPTVIASSRSKGMAHEEKAAKCPGWDSRVRPQGRRMHQMLQLAGQKIHRGVMSKYGTCILETRVRPLHMTLRRPQRLQAHCLRL
jgi:hypothetical protein